jgi:hypothetical protein
MGHKRPRTKAAKKRRERMRKDRNEGRRHAAGVLARK